MKHSRSTVAVIAIVAVAILAIAVLAQERAERVRPLESLLGTAMFDECGLDALSYEQQEHLVGFITGARLPDFTRPAARSFMEKRDWEQVKVIGAVPSTHGIDELNILAMHQYKVYELDPTIIPSLPEPGVYWARFVGSQWTLLYPDGDEGSFSASEVK